MVNFGKHLRHALIGLSLSNHAWAAWSSGGGELIKDANNPWFIQNTQQVRYCIRQDQAVFHVKPEQVEQGIAAAIGYWKNEFALTSRPMPGGIEVGTQEFKRVDCGDNVELVFQFGYLDQEQLQ